MKRLALLRHAKSSLGESGRGDLDRPLSERGWKAARRMGRELAERRLDFDLVLASPAARVRETIDGLAEKLKLEVEIRFEPRLYLASEGVLFDIVREAPESAASLLVVGHNPGLQQLAIALAGGEQRKLLGRIEEKFPTAALAIIDLPARRWAEVVTASGEIAELIFPKELD